MQSRFHLVSMEISNEMIEMDFHLKNVIYHITSSTCSKNIMRWKRCTYYKKENEADSMNIIRGSRPVDRLRPRQIGRHIADGIFKLISLYEIWCILIPAMVNRFQYCHTSNINLILVGNETVNHSHVVGACIACRHCSNYIFILNLTPWANTTVRWDKKLSIFGFGATYIRGLMICHLWLCRYNFVSYLIVTLCQHVVTHCWVNIASGNWCLTTPSHYLNQCSLITSGVQWPEGNFTGISYRSHQLSK